MASTFAAEVDAFVLATDKRILALIRQSTQDVIDQAQLPTGKGGKMRVDTGFLRASGQMSLSGFPTGPVRGDPKGKYEYNGATVITTLSQVQIGQTIFFGWTANYAIYREAYDGFLASAVQNWQAIVSKNAAAIKARSR